MVVPIRSTTSTTSSTPIMRLPTRPDGRVCGSTIGPGGRLDGLIENHHLPDRLAFVQQVEPAIDFVELEASRQQLVHRQPALRVEINIARDVPRRHARTDITPL